MTTYQQTNKTDGSTIRRVVVAACFVVLCWLWVYFFQADSLAVEQHLLSNGQTIYERHVGACIITLVMLIAQQLLYLLTSKCIPHRQSEVGAGVFFSRELWVQLLVAFTFLVGVILLVGTNAVEHFTHRTEMCLIRQQPQEALRQGERSLETSPRLTMLRAYALAHEGQLGERFFRYPVAGVGADLLPAYYSPADTARAGQRLMEDSHTWTDIFPTDSIFRLLGAMPKGHFTTARYLQLLCSRDSVRMGNTMRPLPQAARDYRLTMLLIDRKLDQFARLLPHYYKLNDSLPRHYREALVLYRHLTTHPRVVYRHNETEENFADYKVMQKQYGQKSERRIQRLENFFGTYWYYYDYASHL